MCIDTSLLRAAIVCLLLLPRPLFDIATALSHCL